MTVPAIPTAQPVAARAFARSALGLMVAALAACSAETPATDDSIVAEAPAPDAAAAPQVIDVSAGDFFYTMSDTVSAGATTFRLATTGQEMHHVQLVRLDEGHTLAELLGAMQGPPPEWAHFVGGPNAPIPNAATSSVTLDLAPGTYAVLCMIPSSDGVPHVAKGMSKTLVVSPSSSVAVVPTATTRMTLTDYDFVLSAPLSAGAQVIEVVNTAAQEHEVFIAKLAPGVTAAQMLQWLEKQEGPPPGAPAGGTVGLSTGMTNFVHANLEPGEYALICFIPDAGDGRPHFMHGMVKQITVM